MPRSPSVAISDILGAIDGIAVATAGKTLDEFKADWLLRHGVQRGIEIISEAARRLPDELLADWPEIPWPQIRAVGNVLRHEYSSVSDDIIWHVVVDDIPALRRAIEGMKVRVERAERQS
jgi:uncharacterized protein with HEPN domain